MLKVIIAISCLLWTHNLVCRGALVAYTTEQGGLVAQSRPELNDPASALGALATAGVSETGQRLYSAVPAGTRVLGLRAEGETVTVEFSREIVAGGLDELRLTTIFQQVRATLAQFGVNGNIRLQFAGKLLSDYLPPVVRVAPASSVQVQPRVAGSLVGKKIALSPGHGVFWTGSTWTTQRPVYCSPLNQEDLHNLETMQFLDTYLTQEGATTKNYRCLDKSFGTHAASGKPWWQMAACYWEKQLGYPCTVYANSSGSCTLAAAGLNYSNDDVRARPSASDYDNTDIYVSLHSNGSSGFCTGAGCPTGSETYYDASTEHAAWGAVSQTLATRIHNALMSAISGNADATWTCHGTCVKDSAGAYGEIRIPDRAATLTELAFHDTCDRDADTNHLRDNFFRCTAMWGMYKGICDYFGATPTWDFYSCELISDDIPATMAMGSTATVHIKVRNRGVLWNAAKLFRLGAGGDSDPFTTTTRYTVGGEVGPGQTNSFTVTFQAPSTPGTYVTDWQMLRESVSPIKRFGPTLNKSVVVTDTQAPTAPTNLMAAAVAPGQINLNWFRSIDNVGVSNYVVYRNSALLGTSSLTNYSDTECSPNTTYSYQVSALDAASNQSARSVAAQATTPAPLPPVLRYSFGAGALTLTWTNGVLQQATNLNASPILWSDVAGATNPFAPALDSQARFFRLRD